MPSQLAVAVARAIAYLAIACGLVVLLGWAFDLPALKSVLPGLVTMKPNTALGFVLSGIALSFLARAGPSLTEPPQPGAKDAAARICAVAVFLIGFLTLVEYVFAVDLGIDELLFRDDSSPLQTYARGRPSVVTAANFCLIALALAGLDFETRRKSWPAQWFALAVACSGYLALVGYVFSVNALYRVHIFSSMAVHTAALFTLFAAGVLCARPRRGLSGLVFAEDAGGRVMRKLLPAAMLVPLALGWLRLVGERAGLYEFEFGLAILVVSMVVCFTGLTVWVARATQKSTAIFSAMVESSPVAKVAVDGDGRIVLANPQMEALFGYRCEELRGQPLEALLPENTRALHSTLTDSLQGSPQKHDLNARRKDGTEFPVEVAQRSVLVAGDQLALIVIVDLTERTQQQTALRQAYEALERSNIELQKFAYVASHDLQTPMRSIATFVDLLRETYGNKLDSEANDWIRRISASVEQLRTLVRDLLEYSRVDSKSHPFERIELRAVVDTAVSLLEASIRESGASVICGELPSVMGDRSQLVQLMLNLIGNGLKYRSSEPPRIEVSAERQDAEWTISVRDNGIGIAPRHYDQIFEMFKRLHRQDEYPGSGIGLAVCRRVVHRHGGRIWVDAGAGDGSIFRFTTPAEERSSL